VTFVIALSRPAAGQRPGLPGRTRTATNWPPSGESCGRRMRITDSLGAEAPIAYPVLMRSESAGAPQHGQPQDWRHRTMPKGFVSERDLNPHVRNLLICVAI
jgi:hypothetical protein